MISTLPAAKSVICRIKDHTGTVQKYEWTAESESFAHGLDFKLTPVPQRNSVDVEL